MNAKSMNKFDLTKKTYDLVIKPEHLTKLNVQFYEDGKFEYPFFMRKDKAQTMVFKFEGVSTVIANPDTSAVFMVDGEQLKCLNQWLECNDCNKINPDHLLLA